MAVAKQSRTARRQHDHRALAVAPDHRLQQVGLFRLGRHAGRRAGALDIDDDQRQFRHHGQTDGFTFERHAGAAGTGGADVPCVGCADRGTDRGDLIFGLEGLDAEVVFVRGQCVQHVAGRCDRIAGIKQRRLREIGGRQQSVGNRLGAGDVAVIARRQRGATHGVVAGEDLGRVGKVVSGPECGQVGSGYIRRVSELLVDPLHRRFQRTIVEPVDHAQGEEILRAVFLLSRQRHLFQRPGVECGHRDLDEPIRRQRTVVQRALLVSRLFQPLRVEGVGIDDDCAAPPQIAQVHLQRRRIKHHQDIGGIAGRVNLMLRETDLKARHAGKGPRRGAYLGREIRKSAQIIAGDRGRQRKLVSLNLDAVPGVARKTNRDPFKDFRFQFGVLFVCCYSRHVSIPLVD